MSEEKLAWPVARTAPITQGFGENPQVYAQFGLAGHNGLDFGLPMGTPVLAAAAGVVQRIGDQPQGYGLHVRVQHNEMLTLYAHLQRCAVEAGQQVQAGEVLGWSGSSGFSSGPHLHFEVRLAGQEHNGFGGAVDPLPLLAVNKQGITGEAGSVFAVVTALNVRLRPSFDDSLRGRLRAGDVVCLAGTQQVQVGGYTFVPVVMWAASEFLQPASAEPKIEQKCEDFHILHELSTEIHSLSTDLGQNGCGLRRGSPRNRRLFPLKGSHIRAVRWGRRMSLSTHFSTGGRNANGTAPASGG